MRLMSITPQFLKFKKKTRLKEYSSMDQCQPYQWVLVGDSQFYLFQHIANTFCRNIEVIIITAIHKYGGCLQL